MCGVVHDCMFGFRASVATVSTSFLQLCMSSGFLQQFATPLVKVFPHSSGTTRGSSDGGAGINRWFYSLQEYDEWRRESSKARGEVKFYKGLGTNTAAEGRVIAIYHTTMSK